MKKYRNDFAVNIPDETLVVNSYQPDEYNQKWRVTGETVSHEENENLVLDIADQNPDPEATICSYEYNGGDNQHWHFLYQ